MLFPFTCCSSQRTLTVEGSINSQLVSSFTSLDSTGSLHKNNNMLNNNMLVYGQFLSCLTGDKLYSDTPPPRRVFSDQTIINTYSLF